MGNLGHLVGAGLVGLAAGTAVLYGQSKISPGRAMSLYGVPLVGLGIGAAMAKRFPLLGTGIAMGSVLGPFTVPVATKVLGGASHTAAALNAVQLGAVLEGPDEMYDVAGVHYAGAYN